MARSAYTDHCDDSKAYGAHAQWPSSRHTSVALKTSARAVAAAAAISAAITAMCHAAGTRKGCIA